MSILIIGCNGNMGRRYRAALQFLGRNVRGVDIENSDDAIEKAVQNAEGVIIATPTDTHASYIRKLTRFRKPILCEKPITKNLHELKAIFDEIERYRTPFRMVYQYEMLAERQRIGTSHYNYYKTGNDGLVWDCIQVVGLSRKEPSLGNDSPIWRCMINGKSLKIQDMDSAYIGYLQRWLIEPAQDLGVLMETHVKTAELAKQKEKEWRK